MQFVEFISTHAPILVLAIPLICAFLMPLVSRISDKARNIFTTCAIAASLAIAIFLGFDIYANGARTYVFGAASSGITLPSGMHLPVRIMYEVDGISIFMVFISLIVALGASIYSWAATDKYTGKDRYYALLLLMLVGMLGMELTGDIFNMFVFFEILSISSSALTAYYIEGESAEGGLKYMLLSAIGGLFVLIAITLLYSQYNVLNMAALADSIQYTTLDIVALGILMTGFAMKCGAVPLHMVTPDAYTVSPANITAMLVTASQASLYALFRIGFTLFGGSLIEKMTYGTVGIILIVLGVLSMFVGVTMALPQHDVKRLMAYHAVSQTGYMLLGVGVGLAVMGDSSQMDAFGYKAMEGGIFHIINHAMYKGLLFLTAGAMFYVTGTRDLNKMGGLGHKMPWTAGFFIIGALAIAGVPPMNGFSSKLLIYESVYQFSPLLSIVAMVVSILTLASFVKVFHSAFMGPQLSDYKMVREVPKSMIAGMCVLAAVIVVFSLFPDWAVKTIVDPAVDALLDNAGYVKNVMGGA